MNYLELKLKWVYLSLHNGRWRRRRRKGLPPFQRIYSHFSGILNGSMSLTYFETHRKTPWSDHQTTWKSSFSQSSVECFRTTTNRKCLKCKRRLDVLVRVNALASTAYTFTIRLSSHPTVWLKRNQFMKFTVLVFPSSSEANLMRWDNKVDETREIWLNYLRFITLAVPFVVAEAKPICSIRDTFFHFPSDPRYIFGFDFLGSSSLAIT